MQQQFQQQQQQRQQNPMEAMVPMMAEMIQQALATAGIGNQCSGNQSTMAGPNGTGLSYKLQPYKLQRKLQHVTIRILTFPMVKEIRLFY